MSFMYFFFISPVNDLSTSNLAPNVFEGVHWSFFDFTRVNKIRPSIFFFPKMRLNVSRNYRFKVENVKHYQTS